MKPDYIIWKITETEEELRAGLSHPELFARKVENLKPGSRRMLEVLAVRRAMKVLFNDEEKEVLYTDEGAPYLLGGPCISISHTDGYAAVIMNNEPVAIDIERRGHRVQKVVSHFLRPEEIAVLDVCVASASPMVAGSPIFTIDLDLLLHLAWSAKETAFKILGKDFYDLQNLTTIQLVDVEKRLILLGVQNRPMPLQIHFDVQEDYVLTYLYQTSQVKL